MSEREKFKAHFMAEGFDERNFERYYIHDPEDEANYRNTQIELMWQGWQACAAIAASQQAAPKAMTDEQIEEIGVHLGCFQAKAFREDRDQEMTQPERIDYWRHIKFARAIEAAAGPNAALVEALKGMMELAWDDTREIHFDDTVMFGQGYDFFGWESLRMEIHTRAGSWATWKSNNKYSAYGGPDGSMWLEKFNTRAEAEEVVLREIDRVCPMHPTAIARAALASLPPKQEARK